MRTPLNFVSIALIAILSTFSSAQIPYSGQEKSLGEVAREARQNRQQSSPPETDSSDTNDLRWRISPEKINVAVDHARELQLLDDSAQELSGAIWSIDDSSIAELTQHGNHVFVHALAPGTVHVKAVLDGETRTREIRIWNRIPQGKSNWGLHPIGRELGDIPAVPTGGGPAIYSLEQTEHGDTYLRADTSEGVQLWTWLMPDTIHDVKLVCGDWLGGAVITASDADSYYIYAVTKDGKLRWRQTATGVFRNLAINTDNMMYLLTGSKDGTAVELAGIDESTGEKRFDLAIPSSRLIEDQVKRADAPSSCSPKSSTTLLPIVASRVIVNMDSLAYLAFAHKTRTVKSEANCGGVVAEKRKTITQDDELVLWQIHPDGTLRTSVIEDVSRKLSPSQSMATVVPSGSITTDNFNGILLPVEVSDQLASTKGNKPNATFIYRIDPEGHLLYRSKMPGYTGSLYDDMVIGDGGATGFATRGDRLIAFKIETGEEMWEWTSSTDGIEVLAALANGHCLVQTPTALVEVADSTSSLVHAQGKFILDWQGHLLKVHN